MEPQRIVADNRIKADLGTVALKYGPLIYNVETADEQNIGQPLSDAPLKAEWRPDLLGGVMVITGKWQDGSPMTAVPNYARMNRVGPPVEYLGDTNVNYAPGASTSAGATAPATAPVTAATVTPNAGARNRRTMRVESKVWI
jgi:hypothetical protein